MTDWLSRRLSRRRWLVGSGLVALSGCAPRAIDGGSSVVGPPASRERPSARSVVERVTPYGVVASSERSATDAGLAILRAGGNAADAAVATAAALHVSEPMMTGLGGDCFALFYSAKTHQITALNGSGRSAAALTADLARSQGMKEIPQAHGYAVTVPGTCAGFVDLIERHGRLPFARVLEPAIGLAEDGVVIGPHTAEVWAKKAKTLLDAPGKGGSLLVDGRAPSSGATFKNPPLARALRAIASGGKDAFYRGPIAEAIVRAVKAAGGVMELSDLAAHTSTWDDPISTEYRGHRIWECPPNGQGLTALLALNILDGFDLAKLDPLGAERLHLVTEALRLAFADARAFIADPRATTVPVAELLSKEYAAKRRSLIDPRKAGQAPHGAPLGRSDTVYLCVVDAEGNACSFINSVFTIFATGLVPGALDGDPEAPNGYGFVLQNRGASFTLDDGHPDVLAPNKRPYHTIIPGLITRADGSLYGPFGVMGGYMQPQGHVQVVSALLDDGATPQAAIDRPRLCVNPTHPGTLWPSDGSAVQLWLEQGIPPATAEALLAKGHDVVANVDGFKRLLFGRGQVIRRAPDGTLDAGSDTRADGYAART
jgi:gamma-glutamyltranspeptidase/glutathione hydrolase